jgi:tetratricopeptide (TPR) repeat protein
MRASVTALAAAMMSALTLATGAAQPPPAAVPTPADPQDAALAEARALIDAGKPTAAVEKLRALGPETRPRVSYLLGLAYYHAGDPTRAIEQLTAALPRLDEGSPERRETVQVLGLSHYLAGHIAESIPFLEQTRAAMPESADLAQALATAYAQTAQPSKARESWARAFGVPADSAAAHLLAAQMMIRAGLEEMAEAELKQALAKDPRLPRVHLLLGQTALFRGRLDEAVALLQEELRVSPAEALALHLLGDAYSRQLKWDAAVAALQKSIWINPYFSGPYILLGKAYMKKGDAAMAEGMLRQAVQYDPNNKAAHYLLGQLLQQAGRTDEARRELETAERLPGVREH